MTDKLTAADVPAYAERLEQVLQGDLDSHLKMIDQYMKGEHAQPYMPDMADAEYRLLAKRAVTNWMPLLVDTPSQGMYVDGFRRGKAQASASADMEGKAIQRRELPEWLHWEQSRMAARQDAVTRGALKFGHSFVATEIKGDKVLSRGLSPLRTSALFEDPANDDNAVVVLHIKRWPSKDGAGEALLWDRTLLWSLTKDKPKEGSKSDKATGWRVSGAPVEHGGDGENPVTRFAASVDLEGNTLGVIEPMIAVQDRINQSVFDLLVAQTGGSFKTRTATGMAPPVYIDEETGEPKLGPDGNPIPLPINFNAKRMLFGEDPEVKFGTLDETPLGPYVEAIDLAVRHLSALSQTPPHHLLGQIANLSAEALQAAETALSRKVSNFKSVFGESWERVFRMALKLSGNADWDDATGEVLWRDMESSSLSATADALHKLKDLGIPERGLWPRVPNITQGELALWEELADEALAGGIAFSRPSTVGVNPAPVTEEVVDEQDSEGFGG